MFTHVVTQYAEPLEFHTSSHEASQRAHKLQGIAKECLYIVDNGIDGLQEQIDSVLESVIAYDMSDYEEWHVLLTKLVYIDTAKSETLLEQLPEFLLNEIYVASWQATAQDYIFRLKWIYQD